MGERLTDLGAFNLPKAREQRVPAERAGEITQERARKGCDAGGVIFKGGPHLCQGGARERKAAPRGDLSGLSVPLLVLSWEISLLRNGPIQADRVVL